MTMNHSVFIEKELFDPFAVMLNRLEAADFRNAMQQMEIEKLKTELKKMSSSSSSSSNTEG